MVDASMVDASASSSASRGSHACSAVPSGTEVPGNLVGRFSELELRGFSARVANLLDKHVGEGMTGNIDTLHRYVPARAPPMSSSKHSKKATVAAVWLKGAPPADICAMVQAFITALEIRASHDVDEWSGLFRVGGTNKHTDECEEKLKAIHADAGQVTARTLFMLKDTKFTTQVIATTMKRFLLLHKPLILHHDLVLNAMNDDKLELNVKISALQCFVWLLPDGQRTMLRILLPFLKRVAETKLHDKADQQMTVNGLARLFAVNLFPDARSVEDMGSVSRDTALLTLMIEHHDKVLSLPDELIDHVVKCEAKILLTLHQSGVAAKSEITSNYSSSTFDRDGQKRGICELEGLLENEKNPKHRKILEEALNVAQGSFAQGSSVKLSKTPRNKISRVLGKVTPRVLSRRLGAALRSSPSNSQAAAKHLNSTGPTRRFAKNSSAMTPAHLANTAEIRDNENRNPAKQLGF